MRVLMPLIILFFFLPILDLSKVSYACETLVDFIVLSYFF